MSDRSAKLIRLDLPPALVPTRRSRVSTLIQKLVLLAVEQVEGVRITQDQLGELTGVSPASVNAALLVLEERGIIFTAVADPSDTRYTDRCKGPVNCYRIRWGAVAEHATVDLERTRCNKTARGHRDSGRAA